MTECNQNTLSSKASGVKIDSIIIAGDLARSSEMQSEITRTWFPGKRFCYQIQLLQIDPDTNFAIRKYSSWTPWGQIQPGTGERMLSNGNHNQK